MPIFFHVRTQHCTDHLLRRPRASIRTDVCTLWASIEQTKKAGKNYLTKYGIKTSDVFHLGVLILFTYNRNTSNIKL